MKRTHLVILIAAILTLTPATAAVADEGLDPDVAYALEHVPGGVAIDHYTAVWPDLGITFTVPSPFTRSVGSCNTGLVCAYRSPGQGGAKTTFSGACTTWSTAGFGDVMSVANARTSGWVNARDAGGANITYVGYGTSRDTPTQTIKSIACAGDGIV